VAIMNLQDLDTALKMAFKASYVSAIDAAYMLARQRQVNSASLMPALAANMLTLVQENLDSTAPPPISLSTGGGRILKKSSIWQEKIAGTRFKELFDLTEQESCLWLAIPRIRVVDAAFILCKRLPPDGVEFTEPYEDDLLFKMASHIHQQLKASANLETITQHQFRTLAAALDVNIESVAGTKPAVQDKKDYTKGHVAAPAVAEGASNGAKPSEIDWRNLVRSEAWEHWVKIIAENGSATLENVSLHLAKWCVTNNVKGDHGNFPQASYLKTHVISGKYWAPPRNMSREAAKKHLEQKKHEKQAN
jgi:hypothetical protein